jgi:sodium-dependent dicarboxylate transporter 2/3/5
VRRPARRPAIALALLLLVTASAPLLIREPVPARAAVVAGACLVLWLSEVVPPFVPTIVLLVSASVFIGPLDARFALTPMLGSCANPVLALFFGGFALGVAAERHGIDILIARGVVRLSRGRRIVLLSLVAAATGALSMWMSNIAAAAMMLAALRPALGPLAKDDPFRRATLLALACGANFGGIATPVGTGPNAIAIAELGPEHPISFAQWMAFGLPLAGAMTAAAIGLLALGYRVRGTIALPADRLAPPSRSARAVMALFAVTVAAWLAEPIHHLPTAAIALAAAAALFGTGLLDRRDISRIDWSTLILIAGGIAMGRLVEQSGLVAQAVRVVDWSSTPSAARVLCLVVSSALLSAVMSNTGTVAMLVPLATAVDPRPAVAVLVAIGASFGVPFAISTPPNAMVYGEGGLRASDLAWPGLLLMLAGCALVAFTGPAVLVALGVR